MTPVALFARRDSIYKQLLPTHNVYDEDRDARTFDGDAPVICHPPCRGWGRLRGLAKVKPGELDLGRMAVRMVRRNGGVLEHPHVSLLWRDQGLPEPGQIDEWGGYTIFIKQHDFGHLAEKKTRLYIVGCRPADLPVMPLALGEPTHTCCSVDRKYKRKKEITHAAREHTPRALAEWLIATAAKCRPPPIGGEVDLFPIAPPLTRSNQNWALVS